MGISENFDTESYVWKLDIVHDLCEFYYFFLYDFLPQNVSIRPNHILLKNLCEEKNIKLSNDNIKEEHLGIKKLHLNRKGNIVFAKKLINFIEGNWDFSSLGDSYF